MRDARGTVREARHGPGRAKCTRLGPCAVGAVDVLRFLLGGSAAVACGGASVAGGMAVDVEEVVRVSGTASCASSMIVSPPVASVSDLRLEECMGRGEDLPVPLRRETARAILRGAGMSVLLVAGSSASSSMASAARFFAARVE